VRQVRASRRRDHHGNLVVQATNGSPAGTCDPSIATMPDETTSTTRNCAPGSRAVLSIKRGRAVDVGNVSEQDRLLSGAASSTSGRRRLAGVPSGGSCGIGVGAIHGDRPAEGRVGCVMT
jgi:hypothetical protein